VVVTRRRMATASVFANPDSCSLTLHVEAVDVPKQWMSPTAERVWHRMKRLKDTEMRLWAEEEAAKAVSPWRRFGLYPLFGLSAVAMISKEWMLILLGEYQYIPIFALAVSGIYVYGRGGIEDWFRTGHAKARAEDVEIFDFKIEMAQEALTEHRSNAMLLDLVQEYKSEHMDVRKELANYYTLKPKHEARDKVVAQLEAIYAKQLAEEGVKKAAIVGGSMKHVIGQIQGDAAFRAQAVAQAIDLVGTKLPSVTETDPVVKLFNDYLRGFGKGPMKLK